MTIWLISIFEQTTEDKVFSTRFISIVDEALKKGHNVIFFASTFKHNTKIQRFKDTKEIINSKNYKIVFVKSEGYKKNIGIKRLFSHYKFGNDLIIELDKHEKPDIILFAFPPIHLSYKVSSWAKNNKIPVVMDIIDPWPDIFIKPLPVKLKFLGHIFFYPLKRKLTYILNNISSVSAISNQYLKWAQTYTRKHLQTHCFYPSTDLSYIQSEVSKIGLELKGLRDNYILTVIYAGSLASSYDIPCILQTADILNRKYQNKIKFKIAGVGPQEKLIYDYINKNTNLEYLGRLPKDELMKQYYLSDLGLTQHTVGASQSVTYKLFDLLANGLPILNSLESEMDKIITDNRVGLFNKPGDYNKLAENIEIFYNDRDMLNEYKSNAIKLTARLGDTKIVYAQMVNVLENIVNERSSLNV